MKNPIKHLLTTLILLSALNIQPSTAHAQGTAFTYQGQLQYNGGLASGTYNLTFSLYTNSTGGTASAGSVTNNAVTVTDGLFTVRMDFGPGPWNGQTNWLQIGVESNGVSPFTTLTPRQELTPVPYAIFANTSSNVLGTVLTEQLSGTLQPAQLPSAVVTNGEPSVTLSNVTLVGILTLPSPATINSGGSSILQADGDDNFYAGPGAGTPTNSGSSNTGIGVDSLGNNINGTNNTAIGYEALHANTNGAYNTASGERALLNNTSGDDNTADGRHALEDNVTGNDNTAEGYAALSANPGGSFNIALGSGAGENYGNNENSNIDIGSPGVGGDNNLIRIGSGQTQTYIAGVINGNGGGLTNLNASQLTSGTVPGSVLSGVQGTVVWQVVSGTAVQAQPNTCYLLTNSSKVTVTLPVSPNVGDVVEVSGSGLGGWNIIQDDTQSVQYGFASAPAWVQTSAPNEEWTSITSSSDGTILAATEVSPNNQSPGGIYISTNSGVKWSLTSAPSNYWSSIASSSDGTILVAVVSLFYDGTGGIYVSTNTGATWSLTGAPTETWSCVASSSDGTKLAATVYGGAIYTSTNAGATWNPTSATGDFIAIASSSDGSKLAAALGGNFDLSGAIYTSTNFGATWSLTSAPAETWFCVASSSDGGMLAAAAASEPIYTDFYSGTNWNETSAPATNWTCIASSSDGAILAAGVGNGLTGGIYISTTSGANWCLTSAPITTWAGIACSSDGTKLAAAVGEAFGNFGEENYGGIWTYSSSYHPLTTSTGTLGLLGGEPGSYVKLVYTGGGQFVVVNQQGSIYGL